MTLCRMPLIPMFGRLYFPGYPPGGFALYGWRFYVAHGLWPVGVTPAPQVALCVQRDTLMATLKPFPDRRMLLVFGSATALFPLHVLSYGLLSPTVSRVPSKIPTPPVCGIGQPFISCASPRAPASSSLISVSTISAVA